MSAGSQYFLCSCICLSTIIGAIAVRLFDYVPNDLYFDRMVMIKYYTNKTNSKNQAVGVLINENHVLTSFNPFREISRTRSLRDNIKVIIVVARSMDNGHIRFYQVTEHSVACARQVITLRKKDLTVDQWHGTDHKHSPVHDLMILRLSTKLKFMDPKTVTKYSDIFAMKKGYYDSGPLKTDIAEPDDFLGREIRFATNGLGSRKDVERNFFIHHQEYSDEDNVEVNCEEWLPRDWGHFICIRNDDRYEFMGSGAMLVYDEAVFGVGSFVLNKANSTILVFTDVRPYHGLIFKTCTKDDGGPL